MVTTNEQDVFAFNWPSKRPITTSLTLEKRNLTEYWSSLIEKPFIRYDCYG